MYIIYVIFILIFILIYIALILYHNTIRYINEESKESKENLEYDFICNDIIVSHSFPDNEMNEDKDIQSDFTRRSTISGSECLFDTRLDSSFTGEELSCDTNLPVCEIETPSFDTCGFSLGSFANLKFNEIKNSNLIYSGNNVIPYTEYNQIKMNCSSKVIVFSYIANDNIAVYVIKDLDPVLLDIMEGLVMIEYDCVKQKMYRYKSECDGNNFIITILDNNGRSVRVDGNVNITIVLTSCIYSHAITNSFEPINFVNNRINFMSR